MSGIQYDDLACARIDAEYDAFRKNFLLKENLKAAGDFLVKASEGRMPIELSLVQVGGFNAGLTMSFKNSVPLLIRFPRPVISRFSEEKIRREVAIMQYLTDLTAIPVPFVLRFGMPNEEPGLGPYILMEFIRHTRSMSDVLNTPGTYHQSISQAVYANLFTRFREGGQTYPGPSHIRNDPQVRL